MRGTWGLGLTIVALAMVSGCNPGEPTEFSPSGGNFKVMMPGSPSEKSQTVMGITLKMYSYENSDGAMAVAYADMPIGENESYATMNTRLDGAVRGMMATTGAVLKSSTKIYLEGKNPGREVVADVPSKNGTMRARIYIVGRRMYQQVVVGVPSFVNSENSTKFLDSLSLTK